MNVFKGVLFVAVLAVLVFVAHVWWVGALKEDVIQIGKLWLKWVLSFAVALVMAGAIVAFTS